MEGESDKYFRDRVIELTDLWEMGLWGLRVTAILSLKQLFVWCCCRLVGKRGGGDQEPGNLKHVN